MLSLSSCLDGDGDTLGVTRKKDIILSLPYQAPPQTAVTTVLDEISAAAAPGNNHRRLVKQHTVAGGEHDLGVNLDGAKRGEWHLMANAYPPMHMVCQIQLRNLKYRLLSCLQYRGNAELGN